MKKNEHHTQNRGKRKGAAMACAAVGGTQKKQRSSPQHISQVTKPLNRQCGSRNLQTQSPLQCPSTALQSADSDVARGCIALLALHRTSAEGTSVDSDDVVGGLMQRAFCRDFCLNQQKHNSGQLTQLSCMQDELGLSDEHYDVMMSKAAELCRLKNAAEKRTKTQEKQALLDRLKHIQEHLDKCKKLHSQGLLSKSCLDSVQRELSTSLQAVQKQVDSIQQHIDSLVIGETVSSVTVKQDKEVLNVVLNIVAEGCWRKRHSLRELS